MVPTMELPSEIPTDLTSSTLTAVNVAALGVFLAYQAVIKWFDWKSKRDETAKLEALIAGITAFLDAVNKQYVITTEFQDEMKATMSGVRRLLADMTQKNAGVMNRDNSVRVIEHSFQNVVRDIVAIFTASLENNGYSERPEFIKNRVKTAVGQMLDNLRASLSVFQMSIDDDLFFRSVNGDDKGDRYALAAELWNLVEPLYSKKLPLNERLEEMRLVVPNCVRDYVAAIKGQIRAVETH